MIGNRLLAYLAGTAFAAIPTAALGWDTIRLGGIASMSGAGTTVGNVARLGWQVEVEEVNAAGGIGGKPVELALGDSQTAPHVAWPRCGG
ncbi:ABC transporter substrate-binding protein [Paracoccus kondratievae]|uniref:ABC transporter substrate-binding protein n=1 Tax=Paracoccus kondratievae TaxID=135740 RepID=UPI0012662AC1|nr:ABC transporter substrate-binding protein [Paracoccus kondratievae]QFQ86040.1 ABC transporter substrate-binding protein [Paracoccus kondratievae]